MVSLSPRYQTFILWCIAGWCCGAASAVAQDSLDDIETMTAITIESIGLEEERDIRLPELDATTFVPLAGLTPPKLPQTPRTPYVASRITHDMPRDSTADRKGVRKPVRPIKTDRPPYPQIARRKGWEGMVTLRLNITVEGIVKSVVIRKSSGFPELDESAMQAVETWRFAPATDGAFPIPATVDLPVRFNLDEYKP